MPRKSREEENKKVEKSRKVFHRSQANKQWVSNAVVHVFLNVSTELKLVMDITMACVNGKERNEEEWKKLFMEAGFQDYKIFPLTKYLSVIEIYPQTLMF